MSCNTTRHVPEGQYLLQQNRIKGVNFKLQNELRPYLRQKPNDRILNLLPLKLWVYNIGKSWSQNNANAVNRWLMEKVGQPPVIYDSSRARKSDRLIQQNLHNNGYFNAEVERQFKNKKQKKAVTYQIQLGPQYVIRKVHFKTGTHRLSALLKKYASQSLLQAGEPYSVKKLKRERSKIARFYRNKGYIYFNQEYVQFQIDSSKAGPKADIYVKVLLPQQAKNRQQYKINKVYIMPEHKRYKKLASQQFDTLTYSSDIHIITQHPDAYRWKVILNNILLTPGTQNDLQNKYDLTLNRLSDLGIFSYVDINFSPAVSDSVLSQYDDDSRQAPLNTTIHLSPSKSQEMSIELEGNTGEESPVGAAVKYNYSNNNLFKGAEMLSFHANAGLESNVSSHNPEREQERFFNTLDLSGSLNLQFPQFLFPIDRDRLSPRLNPKTRISSSYNYQRRPNITLTSTNLSLHYDWREFETYTFENRPYKHHTVSPIVLNYLKAGNFSPEIERLRQQNIQIRKSLANQLIIGGGVPFYS